MKISREDRLRESAKISIRGLLSKLELGIVRDPAELRVVRALHSLGIETVIDVGANVGQFGSLLRSAGYRGRIISFEPQDDAFAQLKRRAERDKKWSTHHLALGDVAEESQINIALNSFSSSMTEMTNVHLQAAPKSRTVGQQRVRVDTLSNLMLDLEIDPTASLLKIDTQGYEKRVLRGAGEAAGEMAAIQLELSLAQVYEGQLWFMEESQRMIGEGYILHSFEPGISDQDGRVLQCDALFVRCPRN